MNSQNITISSDQDSENSNCQTVVVKLFPLEEKGWGFTPLSETVTIEMESITELGSNLLTNTRLPKRIVEKLELLGIHDSDDFLSEPGLEDSWKYLFPNTISYSESKQLLNTKNVTKKSVSFPLTSLVFMSISKSHDLELLIDTYYMGCQERYQGNQLTFSFIDFVKTYFPGDEMLFILTGAVDYIDLEDRSMISTVIVEDQELRQANFHWESCNGSQEMYNDLLTSDQVLALFLFTYAQN